MSSITEQLTHLAALLDRGLLTREEFEQQKQQILSGVSGGSGTVIPRGSQPASVGAYTISSLIGQGGMGTVYRARHRTPTRAEAQGGDVALKVMHPEYSKQADFRARFEREASVGLRMEHANIVRVFDLLVDGETLGLVMELVDGRPLSKIIGQEVGPMSWSKARPLFRQLLAGISYAHGKGVIHRDLKPENVLVTPEGVLKIIDFGIAREGRGTTKTGIMGTVDYMAPEQYTNPKGVDHRADIYALGMTLYEMLAGRLPWDRDENEFAIMKRKSDGKLPRASTHYPYIPEGVLAALEKALAVNPKDRFQGVQDFQRALDGATTGPNRPHPAIPTPPVIQKQPEISASHAVQLSPDVATFIREKHINHESSIRSVGGLFILGSIGNGIVAAFMMVFSMEMANSGSSEDVLVGIVICAFMIGFAVLYVWIGTGLRNLDRKVRGVATLLLIINMINIPVGTLFSGYFLYLLHSEQGKRIFADDYKEIIAQTPNVVHKTPMLVWVLLATFVVALILICASAG